MSLYVVKDSLGNFKGYLTNKKDLDLLLKQRPSSFTIYALEDIPGEERVIETIKSQMEEAEMAEGYILFKDEFEYYEAGREQMIIDAYCQIKDIITNISPILRLDEQEKGTIDNFLKCVFTHMQNYENPREEDFEDEIFDYNKYFKVEKMVEHIVGLFA